MRRPVTTPRFFICGTVMFVASTPLASQSTVFVDVSVITMEDTIVRHHQTVVTDGSVITALGDVHEVTVPPAARRIEGTGRFLSPGLADMHVHLLSDPDELSLYLANGVTSIRDLSSEIGYVAWRREIEDGQRDGPNVYLAGMIDAPTGRRAIAFRLGATTLIAAFVFVTAVLVGRTRTSRHRWVWVGAGALAAATGFVGHRVVPYPDGFAAPSPVTRDRTATTWEIRRALDRLTQHGMQSVKLYEHLPAHHFQAAVDLAHARGLRALAHVPLAMGWAATLESGVDEIAHTYFLTEELLRVVPDDADTIARQTYLDRLVRDVADAQVDMTSTIMMLVDIGEMYRNPAGYQSEPNMRFRTAALRRGITNLIDTGASDDDLAALDRQTAWAKAFAVALVRAEVPLVLGTDTGPHASASGFGVHAELRVLTEAGLTPFEALQTATVNASRVTPDGDRWGTIKVGHRADLLLVSGNPLVDTGVLAMPHGVMVRGRWYDRPALDQLLERVAARRVEEVTPDRRSRRPPA